MFTVIRPEEVYEVLRTEFPELLPEETVSLSECCGRILARDIAAPEEVPGFERSTVDGYAVRSRDTFGCSEAIPAILQVQGEIHMGEAAAEALPEGFCCVIPTGGALPDGSDAVVMVEYTEDYGDGTIGMLKPVSPGSNVIHRGEDTHQGDVILPAGRELTVSDVGSLAAMGITAVPVRRRPAVGILSTGDELVLPEEHPAEGQIRDANGPMLAALCESLGAQVRSYGIVRDEESRMNDTVLRALAECDVVIASGGTSVGTKDQIARVIEANGRLLFHGIAMKPGKPTILGKVAEKPVFGLPGHPVAAFFSAWLYVRFLLAQMAGRTLRHKVMEASLTEAVNANHGREEYIGVQIAWENGVPAAHPVRTKSGLITALARTDGFITVPRDCEGLPRGTLVPVSFYTID